MSNTAKLVNAHGRVTLHQCIRLEMRGEGQNKGIYPIYRCTETGIDRVFGCLRAVTNTYWLDQLFPDIELIRAEPEPEAQTGGMAA